MLKVLIGGDREVKLFWESRGDRLGLIVVVDGVRWFVEDEGFGWLGIWL